MAEIPAGTAPPVFAYAAPPPRTDSSMHEGYAAGGGSDAEDAAIDALLASDTEDSGRETSPQPSEYSGREASSGPSGDEYSEDSYSAASDADSAASEADLDDSESAYSSDSEVYGSKRKRARPKKKKTQVKAPRQASKRTPPPKKKKPQESGVVSDESDSEASSDSEDGRGRGKRRQMTDADYEIPLVDVPDPPVVDAILVERGEKFLVHWRGRSHWHDTWERRTDIDAHVNGTRRLADWDRGMRAFDDGDDADARIEEWRTVERVISHGDLNGAPHYLVKWADRPYAQCTWEDAERVAAANSDAVDAYVARSLSGGLPAVPATFHRRFAGMAPFKAPPPFLAAHGALRDYQLAALNWLLRAWTRGTSVMLADEMGLGKTVQTVAFLSALVRHCGHPGPFLVVVPLSTLANWMREFARWAPGLNAVAYVGDAPSRGVVRRYETRAPGADRLLLHVLVTTYELVLRDAAHLSLPWRALVVDEGHRLKRASSALHGALDALAGKCFRLLVTGTPLQNSLAELWALLHFLAPERFPDYESFAAAHAVADPQSPETAARLSSLHALLAPHILRRMKRDVEAALPARTERILRVDMAPAQAALSRLILAKNYGALAAAGRAPAASLANVLMELKKAANHPALVVGDDYDLPALVAASGKMALLDQLLTRLRAGGHRVLLFSQMVRMLDVLERYAAGRGWSTQRLDGSTPAPERARAIASFNAPGSPDFLFLLSTRAGGLGINLETADTVVLYDSDWNPQNDLQAMARAHRIGQTRPVAVYRLVTADSVEETILERAKHKMVLDHLVIRSMAAPGAAAQSAMSRDDVQAVLKFAAQRLFRERDAAPPADLDAVLARAEPAAPEGPDATGSFLNQFSVAECAVAPDALPAWDDILPPDVVAEGRAAAEEDARREKEVELQEALLTAAAGRRPRQPAARDAALASADAVRLPKEATRALLSAALVHGTDEAATPRLVAAALAALPKDAAGDTAAAEHARHALRVLRRLLDGDADAARLSSGVHVNLAQLRERAANMAAARRLVSSNAPSLPATVRGVATAGNNRWRIAWRTPADDIALVRGVVTHGWGAWDAIADDPELHLGHIRETLHVDGAIPRDIHLGRRVENVLMHVVRAHDLRQAGEAPPDAAPKKTRPPKDSAASDAQKEDRPAKAPRDKVERAPRPKTAPARGAETAAAKRQDQAGSSIAKPRENAPRPGQSQDERLRALLRPVRRDVVLLSGLSPEDVRARSDDVLGALRRVGAHIAAAGAADDDLRTDAWSRLAAAWPLEIAPHELEAFCARI